MSSTKKAGGKSTAKRGKQDLRKVVRVGLHFGDSKTRVAASKNGDPVRLKRDVFTNIVGFLKLHGPAGRASGGKPDVLCAEQAVKFLQQVDLRKPVQSGLVNDVRVCRQFVTHVCSAIDPNGTGRLWGVASIPAVAGPEELDKAYHSLKGPLERVVVVPEPYLVAEGMRLEKEARLDRGQDLTRGCLVIDMGAGTTDICLVRGGFPTPADQVRLEVSGNSIDDKIFTNALVHSPTLFLSRRMAREIKEEQAFVGGSPTGANKGSDLVALTDVIRKACDTLLEAIVEGSLNLLGRCDAATAATISRSIILTGGGSRIRNLPAGLEHSLQARGFPEARVLLPEDYQTLVARGALRFAEKLSDEDWQAVASKTPAENASHFSGAEGAGAPLETREADSIAWMDVGLRSEASFPPLANLRATPRPAPPIPSEAPAKAPTPPPKEGEKEFTAADLEELDLFKGR